MVSSDPRLTLTAFHRRDSALVLRLVEQNPQTHYHLDWEPLRRWLYDPANIILLAWEDKLLRGVIAFSPPQQGTSWLRLLSLPNHLRDAVGESLWRGAVRLLAQQVESVHVLVIQPWIEALLRGWRFVQTDAVINLMRQWQPLPPTDSGGVQIRGLRLGDSARVLAVDHAAFPPMWRMRDIELREAGQRACCYKLASYQGRVIGYQLTMHYANSLHLARLATHPDYQRHGIARQLLCDMLHYAEQHRIPSVTVNTQHSNHASQRLYERLGFVSTENDLPVYSISFAPGSAAKGG